LTKQVNEVLRTVVCSGISTHQPSYSPLTSHFTHIKPYLYDSRELVGLYPGNRAESSHAISATLLNLRMYRKLDADSCHVLLVKDGKLSWNGSTTTTHPQFHPDR